MTLLTAGLVNSPALAVHRAIMVGPNYAGGQTFDDTIAADRMTAMKNQFALWGNWNAANIGVLTGAVTQAQVTNAIAGAGVGANDVFVFVYHGHGDYSTSPAANVVGDPPEEQYFLPGGGGQLMDDDTLRTALNGLPATAVKLVINISCYGGGFQNDLATLQRHAFMAGGGELQTIPENLNMGMVDFNGQPFFAKLYANANPANLAAVDTNMDNKISIGEYYNASAVAGSVFAHRWQEDYDLEVQSDFQSVYSEYSSLEGFEDLFIIPEPQAFVLFAIGAIALFARRGRFAKVSTAEA